MIATRDRAKIEFVRPGSEPEAGPVGQRVVLRPQEVYLTLNALEASLWRHCAGRGLPPDGRSILRITDSQGRDIEIAIDLEVAR